MSEQATLSIVFSHKMFDSGFSTALDFQYVNLGYRILAWNWGSLIPPNYTAEICMEEDKQLALIRTQVFKRGLFPNDFCWKATEVPAW